MDAQKLATKAKSSGIIGILHLLAGNSLTFKAILIAAALTVGYASIAVYKTNNAISDVAEQVVENETGIDFHFDGNKK